MAGQIINHFPGDRYESPSRNGASLSCKLCLSPWVYFFGNMARIVVKSALKSSKGLFDCAEYCKNSVEFLNVVENCNCKVVVEGLSNLSVCEGPIVVIGNHMSSLETFLLPGIMLPRKDVAFIVKESLVNYPVFGTVIRNVKHITVSRVNPKDDLKAVMEKGLEYLSSGVSVVVFPQATRNTVFIPEEFNSIGIKLAKKAAAPVVPLALKTDFWGNGKILKEFGPINPANEVHFRFGPPIYIQGNGKAEHASIIEFIQKALQEWKNTNQ